MTTTRRSARSSASTCPSASLDKLVATIDELGIVVDRAGLNRARAMDALWKHCRRSLAGPGFLVNEPLEVSPLAKARPDRPGIVERFHVIVAGSELGNGYSELNDPLEQARRFAEQQAMREAGDAEAQMPDPDFVEALEYGMPPACGFGMSERVFAFFMDKSVRECQIFPLLRPLELHPLDLFIPNASRWPVPVSRPSGAPG